jgi:hypothetical protein
MIHSDVFSEMPNALYDYLFLLCTGVKRHAVQTLLYSATCYSVLNTAQSGLHLAVFKGSALSALTCQSYECFFY